MSGWLILGLLAVAALAALRLLGAVRGPALQLCAAALIAGAAGYAIQGRPSLAGAAAFDRASAAPRPLGHLREPLFGRFTAAERWLIIADSYAARGDTLNAVGVVRAGLRSRPRDAALWTGLGNALADHGRGMGPAAGLAFERARLIAPDHPGPPLFEGLAWLRSGERARALAAWRAALDRTPARAPWRDMLEQGVATLEAGADQPASGS